MVSELRLLAAAIGGSEGCPKDSSPRRSVRAARDADPQAWKERYGGARSRPGHLAGPRRARKRVGVAPRGRKGRARRGGEPLRLLPEVRRGRAGARRSSAKARPGSRHRRHEGLDLGRRGGTAPDRTLSRLLRRPSRALPGPRPRRRRKEAPDPPPSER
jgi:hypothetical protein